MLFSKVRPDAAMCFTSSLKARSPCYGGEVTNGGAGRKGYIRIVTTTTRAPTLSASGVAAADPVRLPPGWLVRGVPQAPLRLGGAAATSAVGAHAGTRSGLCGVKISFKLSPAPPCWPAVTIPRLTTTNTTPAMLSCSCVPRPSSACAAGQAHRRG